MIKNLLLTFIALTMTLPALAYDFDDDSTGATIYYNVLSDSELTAEVTYETFISGNYSGSVVIPDVVTYGGKEYTVTAIDDYAFYLCESLTSVTIPASVTTIGEEAFWGCESLTSVTIPASVTTIGEKAFSGCTSLQKFEVEEGNQCYCTDEGVLFNKDKTTIVCFPAGSSLTTYTIPESVTTIEAYAFSDCDNLTSVTIGDNVTTIGESAFREFDGLTEITIPNNVTTIGDNAFEGCSELQTVTIGSGVTSIGGYAFSDCHSLTTVTIGSSVASIGEYAFRGCSSLSTITMLCETPPNCGSNPFNGLTTANITLYVPEGCTEVYSETDTWKDFGTIEEIEELADGDKFEYDGLYYNVLSTTEVEVTWGGEFDLSGTDSYTGSITIPETAFYGGLYYDVIGIGEYAFFSCYDLTSVAIPASVTTIGMSAFETCISLSRVTIGENVTTIGSYAFQGCSGLTSVTIPASVITIGEEAFNGCTSLKEFVVKEGSQNYSSDDGVLFNKDKTTLICYPAGSEATTYTIPESVTTIGDDAFAYCSKLTYVIIGDNVTTIGEDAFFFCDGLTEITIPNSVVTIGDYAFWYCDELNSVTLGSNVETIGYSAFYNCSSLRSVTSLNPTPPSLGGSNVFYNCKATVYVPAGTIAEYKNLWGTPTGVNGYEELGYAVIKIEAEEGYATYYNVDYDVTMPEGITAYTASFVYLQETGGSSFRVYLDELTGAVPAGTAVVIKGNVGTYLEVSVAKSSSSAGTDGNLLYGNSTTGNTSVDGATSGYRFYKLTRNSADEVGSMGFYWGANNGDSFSIPGNKAWLAIPQSVFGNVASPTSLSIKIGDEDDVTTGISSAENIAERPVSGIYTLQGVRISDMSRKGVYIVDGKKVVKR